MKLNNIKPLKSIALLQKLQRERKPRAENYLNELEVILYSTNICYFTSRILNDEIKVDNREYKLSMLNSEMLKLNRLISKRNILLESEYTKKNTKEFFKKVGLKQKYLKTKWNWFLTKKTVNFNM